MTDTTPQTERQRRIEENLAALGATIDEMHTTNTQIRALLTEQQQGLTRARQALDDAGTILNQIEQRMADEEE